MQLPNHIQAQSTGHRTSPPSTLPSSRPSQSTADLRCEFFPPMTKPHLVMPPHPHTLTPHTHTHSILHTILHGSPGTLGMIRPTQPQIFVARSPIGGPRKKQPTFAVMVAEHW